jgi:hypothetical protein
VTVQSPPQSKAGTKRTTFINVFVARKKLIKNNILISVADTDPYVFGPPGSGSGSLSKMYGSGSFYHQAKIVEKP